MSYNPKKGTDFVDRKLKLRVGAVQVMRMSFYQYNAKVSDVAKQYKLHPLLVKSIKEYRVWSDIEPLGFRL